MSRRHRSLHLILWIFAGTAIAVIASAAIYERNRIDQVTACGEAS